MAGEGFLVRCEYVLTHEECPGMIQERAIVRLHRALMVGPLSSAEMTDARSDAPHVPFDDVREYRMETYDLGNVRVAVELMNLRRFAMPGSEGYTNMRVVLSSSNGSIDPAFVESVDGLVREFFPKY